jgi:nucleoside-diphosphate-sugar epimerase
MEAEYRLASERGLRVIILRGGDFIQPEAMGSTWNRVVLTALAKGKVSSLGDFGIKRAYAYLPDMARAAVGLAEMRQNLPAFADIPFAGYSLSMDEVTEGLGRIMGRKLRLAAFPWWMMRLAAPFWELARELTEMRYLFNLPHQLDPAPLARLLPDFRATPPEDVLRQQVKALVGA